MPSLFVAMNAGAVESSIRPKEIDYNILFRWFAGLNLDDAVWHATTFSKNRDRLLRWV
jgi:transposase